MTDSLVSSKTWWTQGTNIERPSGRSVGRFCGTEGRERDNSARTLECPPSFGPPDLRHMLQGAREGRSDAGQPISRRADRPPAARAGVERADGRELYSA